MTLLLITQTHIGVYHGRQQVAIYEVDWASEPEPYELIEELLNE